MAAEGNAKRLWWSVLGVVWLIAWLSYVWGDPVRGPFAKMVHPHASEYFELHAGITLPFPINQLSKGIDLSDQFKIPGDPIQLYVRRTWWGGWKCNLKVRMAGNFVTIMQDNEVSDEVPSGWQVNFDDRAIEVVDEKERPAIQIIQDGDYNIYINAVLQKQNGNMLILNGKRLSGKRESDLLPTDFPKTLFKYPAYANRGIRQ